LNNEITPAGNSGFASGGVSCFVWRILRIFEFGSSYQRQW